MTVDLVDIVHGESDWDKHSNQNFKALNEDTLHLSGGAVSKQNLVLNSSNPTTTEHWSAPVGGKILVMRNGLYKNGKVNLFSLVHDKTVPLVNDEVQAVTDEYVLQPNTDYDVFFIAFGAVGITSFDTYMICHDADGNQNNIELKTSVVPDPGKSVLYKLSFNSGTNIRGSFRIDNNGSTDGIDHNLFFSEIFVGKSEFWAPAAGDATQTSDTGWISNGVTLLNGAKVYSSFAGDTPTFRILQQGPLNMLMLCGSVNGIAITKGNQTLNVISLPQQVADWFTNHQMVNTHFDTRAFGVQYGWNFYDGKIQLQYCSDTNDNTFWINFNHVFIS